MNATPPLNYRLGFIGAGKLAGSIIRGLLRAKFYSAGEIIASEPFAETREKLQRETGVSVTTENAEIVQKAEIILLGVKPGIVANIIEEIGQQLEERFVISLAAGVDIRSMEAKANARFMRAMTNTPAAICRAVTAIVRGARATDADVKIAHDIFGSIGVVGEVREDQIDAVTALSGSGPAFVYRVIEALAHGGANCGLPSDISLQFAAEMVLGAAQLSLESNLLPNELVKMVVTPGGTTAAGLVVMEKAGTAASLTAAVEAAAKRGREMAQENL
jgi:pyrroline-5-carboxylate reductase